MTKPSAPNRAAAKLVIQHGFLSIPVRLLSATEEQRIQREQYTTDGRKVGYSPAIKNEDGTYGDLLRRDDIVKKVATAHGLVDLDDYEIEAAIVGGNPGTADVLAVHPYALFDQGDYVPSGLIWQVRGDAKAGGVKPLALILAALDADSRFLLLRWVRGGSAYIGALFADGTLYGLRWTDEVREVATLPHVDLTDREVELARELLTDAFSVSPLVLNHPHEVVRAAAEAKALALAEGKDIVLPKAAPTTAPQAANLEALLAKSVEAAKAAREAREKVSA